MIDFLLVLVNEVFYEFLEVRDSALFTALQAMFSEGFGTK